MTAHVSCNCRSPFMDDPADQQEECLRGTVTGLHNATNIPEACHSLPDGACNDNDCENGKKEPKSRDPLWKECRDEIDAWDDDDGLAKPEVNYYCHFSCQEHSERCWVCMYDGRSCRCCGEARFLNYQVIYFSSGKHKNNLHKRKHS